MSNGGRAEDVVAYADVGRAGLGHSLFAWAHALVWASRHQGELLPPIWLRARIGPWLRRERDKRNYFLLFKFVGLDAQLHRAWCLATKKPVQAQLDLGGGTSPVPGALHIFRTGERLNTRALFAPIVQHHAHVRSSLCAMTRPSLLPPPAPEPFIALHIRQGDFKAGNSVALTAGAKNMATSVAWFADTLRNVRKAAGGDLPARLFSDGDDQSLAEILHLPNVHRVAGTTAITDMLDMAGARLIIGSGSNFTLWGSYLGQVPRIFFPGQAIASVLVDARRELAYAPVEGDKGAIRFLLS